MQDQNCELMFEYLRSILYDAVPHPLDAAALDEPYRKLGMGLQVLDGYVREMKAYSAALSRGNLSVEPPARDNLLCENLKNIHANLNHLTWQAKQVAKGDYSQTVSYLGEFSDAFNSMTAQLKERENAILEEAQQEQATLEQEAYHDPLTGIGSRNWFQKAAQDVLDEGTAAVFCYCDLDRLKYVNDTFGHAEGDWYLCHFVEEVKRVIREGDIFARVGGDEFCLILRNCAPELVVDKMTCAQRAFSRDSSHSYEKSFSFGIVALPGNHTVLDLDSILKQADAAMYEQKKMHKRLRGG